MVIHIIVYIWLDFKETIANRHFSQINLHYRTQHQDKQTLLVRCKRKTWKEKKIWRSEERKWKNNVVFRFSVYLHLKRKLLLAAFDYDSWIEFMNQLNVNKFMHFKLMLFTVKCEWCPLFAFLGQKTHLTQIDSKRNCSASSPHFFETKPWENQKNTKSSFHFNFRSRGTFCIFVWKIKQRNL